MSSTHDSMTARIGLEIQVPSSSHVKISTIKNIRLILQTNVNLLNKSSFVTAPARAQSFIEVDLEALSHRETSMLPCIPASLV